MTVECPYCEKPLSDEQSACCGEVGHGVVRDASPSTEAMSPCPACGADKVGTFTADNAFLYGLSCPVRLVAKDVEHFRCMGCGVEFTGEDGERKREQAVRDHLARSPPGASAEQTGSFPIAGRVWFRGSTQEWVLELSGTINDCNFNCRHTEPASTKPEDVPGLPSRYAPEPEDLRAEVERLRVERYLCVLAMRCAMGAHHDGVDAMRERLEPVVARYGIATACAARAAISDADAACIEAQYSRSEIAGSSGEPSAEQQLRDARYMVGMLVHKAGGRVDLSPHDIVTFDSRAELTHWDDPVGGHRIIELKSPSTKEAKP